DQIDATLRVARLHTGLAVDSVVEDDNREIGRPLVADGRKRTEPHQHFAVAGDHHDATLRLRERKTEPDHGGATHRAPQIEITRIITSRREIPGCRAEA